MREFTCCTCTFRFRGGKIKACKGVMLYGPSYGFFGRLRTDQSLKKDKRHRPGFYLKPIQGKVVVELFWNVFCLTSDVEAQRVREVVSEYKNDVVLKEYSAVNPSILKQYGISRGIVVNGKWIEIGPEIEKTTLRQEIENAKIKQQAIK